MKYTLKKDIGPFEKGKEFTEDQILIIQPHEDQNLFEPIPERIELKADQFYCWIGRKNATKENLFTDEQIKLMEQAINGELFTKEDMIEFAISYANMRYSREFIDKAVCCDNYFNSWQKDRL